MDVVVVAVAVAVAVAVVVHAKPLALTSNCHMVIKSLNICSLEKAESILSRRYYHFHPLFDRQTNFTGVRPG